MRIITLPKFKKLIDTFFKTRRSKHEQGALEMGVLITNKALMPSVYQHYELEVMAQAYNK